MIDDELSDQLAAALDDLAGGCRTSAGIARKLASAGSAGERGSSDCCPVVGWLTSRMTIPDGARLLVALDNAEIITGEGDDEQVLAAAPVPQVIASFIIAFDDEGLYPEVARAAGDAR